MRRVLVVSADIPAAAAVCAALHGERVTVYRPGPSSRHAFVLADRFDAILCDATWEVAGLLLSPQHEAIRPRVALLDAAGCDLRTRELLRSSAVPLIHPGDDERIRAFVRGR